MNAIETRIVHGFELEVARVQGKTIRQVHSSELVFSMQVNGSGEPWITAVEWPAGPPGAKLFGRSPHGPVWYFETEERTWRERGKAVAEAVPALEGLLARMRATARRRHR